MTQPPTGLRGLLNIKSAADYLGMYIGGFRKQLKNKNHKPVFYKIGFRYYFKKEDLDLWLESLKNK